MILVHLFFTERQQTTGSVSLTSDAIYILNEPYR